MTKKKVIDLETIAEECNVYTDVDTSVVIDSILKLEELYEVDDLVIIYNYLLTKSIKKDEI